MTDDPHPAQVLLFIRDGIATDWASLCRAFDEPPEETHTGTYLLARALEELQEAGLITLESRTDPGSFKFPKGKITLSPTWRVIQTALGVSLREIAMLRRGRTIVAEPLFGAPDSLPDQLDLFMVMPFAATLKPVYDSHIKKVAKKLKATIKRADDLFTAHDVMYDIWKCICASKAVIADCSGRNANVFYEIGVAHTVGKPVILIAQDKDDVPSDLRHIRYIQYEYTPPGMKQFEQTLEATVKKLLDTKPEASLK